MRENMESMPPTETIKAGHHQAGIGFSQTPAMASVIQPSERLLRTNGSRTSSAGVSGALTAADFPGLAIRPLLSPPESRIDARHRDHVSFLEMETRDGSARSRVGCPGSYAFLD